MIKNVLVGGNQPMREPDSHSFEYEVAHDRIYSFGEYPAITDENMKQSHYTSQFKGALNRSRSNYSSQNLTKRPST